MSRFPVSQEKEEALKKRFAAIGIHEEDLEENFVTSQGPGGQNVNKTATCVILFHRPSGIQVRCQEERSQGLNRFIARRRLAEKLESQYLGLQTEQEREKYKIRRQKKRRSRRTRLKLQQDKEKHSKKKTFRKPVKGDE